MESPQIRLSGIIDESVVDGPGIRYVIFTQGCKHNCKGCHNPSTHDETKGYLKSCDDIINNINETKYLSGVTFSGGEPFLQPDKCAYIAKEIKKEYNIIVYTGYLYEKLLELGKENKAIMDFLSQIDILVDGPFILEQKSLDLKFKGSKNQRMILVKQSLCENKVILYDED